VLFSAKDEAIFAEALRQTFPTVKYLVYSASHTPSTFLYPFDSLTDVPGEYVQIVVPPNPDWRPMPDLDPSGSSWKKLSKLPTHRSLYYYRSVWDWSFYGSERISYDPPTINHGEIFGSYRPWSWARGEFPSLVRRAWRIIGRLATNRYKLGHPLGNRLEGREVQLMKDATGGWIWIGHQALRWCHGHPRRMLSGGFRECDDWQMPQSKWYRSLLQGVEERHGIDCGETPPPPWDMPLASGGPPLFQLSVADAELMRRHSISKPD
jgi:hypothetical protein